MITQKDMLKELTHERGGNGFAVVQWLPDDYCRVVPLVKDGIDQRAYLAWTKMLSPTLVLENPMNPKGRKIEVMTTPKQAEALMSLQNDLESGKKVVRENKIVTV